MIFKQYNFLCFTTHTAAFDGLKFFFFAKKAKYSKYFHKTQIQIKRFSAVSENETVPCNRKCVAFCSDRNSECLAAESTFIAWF